MSAPAGPGDAGETDVAEKRHARPRRGRRASGAPAHVVANEPRIEALTVAMALAPGVYTRNRMFELFEQGGVSRAKSRAATLRGIVKHLARACAITVSRIADDAADVGVTAGGVTRADGADFVLRYQIPAVRLSRVVELSPVELAALRFLVARAGLPCLPADEGDRALVEAALVRLLAAGGATSAIAFAAQELATPPGE